MVRNQGFTLLEIVIVFSVIAILSAIGIAAFVSYSRVQALDTARTKLTATLSLARSRAISQAKPTECGNQILNGYKVVLSTSNNNYELDAVCGGSFSYIVGSSISLPAKITFDATKTTSTYFFFPVIVNGVQFSPPASSATIYLNGYGSTKTVVVDSVGDIK